MEGRFCLEGWVGGRKKEQGCLWGADGSAAAPFQAPELLGATQLLLPVNLQGEVWEGHQCSLWTVQI